jgi:hypothetical protein
MISRGAASIMTFFLTLIIAKFLELVAQLPELVAQCELVAQ